VLLEVMALKLIAKRQIRPEAMRANHTHLEQAGRSPWWEPARRPAQMPPRLTYLISR
jgi:hypothetical protein